MSTSFRNFICEVVIKLGYWCSLFVQGRWQVSLLETLKLLIRSNVLVWQVTSLVEKQYYKHYLKFSILMRYKRGLFPKIFVKLIGSCKIAIRLGFKTCFRLYRSIVPTAFVPHRSLFGLTWKYAINWLCFVFNLVFSKGKLNRIPVCPLTYL